MIAMARPPAYRIETPHLVVRCWEPLDAALLKAAVDSSLDHLRPWMPWVANEPESLEDKQQRLRRFRGQFDLGLDFVFGIFNAEQTEVIGGTGLHTRQGPEIREIGYWIRQDRTGKGFASETAAALTRVAFEIDGIPRVEIRCDVLNQVSAAIPKRLGFLHEQTIASASGEIMIWSMDLKIYAESPAATAPLRAFDVAGRDFVI